MNNTKILSTNTNCTNLTNKRRGFRTTHFTDSTALRLRGLVLSLLALLMFLPASAQTIGEAVYIYRNDGDFNAFYRDEVERIEYSYEDADGITYDDIVTQIVYTADSTYYIPIAAIDSVSFVQPETVMSKDVFILTAGHAPYITNADIDRFTMDSSAPADMLPREGDIVVATADCDTFADGIMARVLSAGSSGAGIEYVCEPVGFEDVFEQLVYYGEVGEEEAAGAKAEGPRKAEGSLTKILWNEPWSKEISYSGTKTTINAQDKASMKVTFRKTSIKDPLFLRVELLNELQAHLDFNAKSEASVAPAPVQIGNTLTIGKITIPIPYTFGCVWLAPKVSLFGYFKEEGKVELDYSAHLNRNDKMVFTYQNGSWDYNHAPSTDIGTDIASLSMEGSAEAGLIPKVFFSLNGTRAGFGADVQVGVKEYINFLFDATRLKTGGLYAANKDSYCRTTIPYSVKLYANANLFGKYDAHDNDQGAAVISYTFADEKQWGEDKYLLPLFSNLRKVGSSSAKPSLLAMSAPAKAAAGTKVVSVEVSRDVLLPAEIGMEVIDEDDNVVATRTAGYTSNSFRDESFTFEFSGLGSSHTYYARPTVSLLGYGISADENIELDGDNDDPDDETLCPDNNHPHAIDLGLPSGTKWACCNVGASAPEQNGGYYAWGETKEKSAYTWGNYAYGSGFYDWDQIGTWDIAGTEYDVARVRWGNGWKMPTSEQMEELCRNCTAESITLNGIKGSKVTAPNGRSLFFPLTGIYGDDNYPEPGKDCNIGFYWSSSRDGRTIDDLVWVGGSHSLQVYKDGISDILSPERNCGLTVRPVK